MSADFLYSTVPSLRSKRAQPEPSAAAALQSGPQHSLRFFEEQDSLAKALLQKTPVYRAAMQAQDGVPADLTSPDRHYHFLAPAASDAPPHWSGTCQFTRATPIGRKQLLLKNTVCVPPVTLISGLSLVLTDQVCVLQNRS